MIKEIRFKNYRVLKDAQLKLGPFTLIVGPNGSGKSTVFHALAAVKNPGTQSFDLLATGGATKHKQVGNQVPESNLEVFFGSAQEIEYGKVSWSGHGYSVENRYRAGGSSFGGHVGGAWVQRMRSFSLDSSKIAEAVPIQPKGELDSFGGNLAAVLDYIRDRDEESFNSLRTELRRWLPEYDAIIFHTPQPGVRSFQLRQAASGSLISARNLSDGTLIALCLLTLAYHPEPPTLVGLEEPDKGLHPRLLREVRDALYRLAFPDQFGIHRDPVQVIATTHSPLFLDLFQDHPEQIVISEKQADGTAKFKNLSEDAQLREIIGDAPLGDVWYSGVLGGVPVLK